MKKLGDKPKLEVKTDKIAEQMEEEIKSKVFSASSKGKYSLFGDQKQLLQPIVPAEDSEETKTVVEEKAAIPKDEVQTKPRIPLTMLSDDEGYLLE